MLRWTPRLLLLLLVGACRPPEQLGALRAVVNVEPGAGIACVEVVAESLDTNRTLTSQADVAGREVLHVGITETATFSGRVRVTVKGYATAGCTGAALVVLPPQEAELGAPPFDTALEFRFRRLAMDGGVDGGAPDAGRPDAGPGDAGSSDAGGDGGVDGGSPDAGVCDMMTCSTLNECELAACVPDGGCERSNRPSTAPCNGGTCNGAGQCVPTLGCVPRTACDAGLSCTTVGVCSDAGTCEPSFAGCVPPPCWRRLNVCASDGGCAFELDPSTVATSCGATLVCYANGECQPFLAAANVTAARAPWPTAPLHFRRDGGAGCVYGWDTGPGQLGAALVPPQGGTTCLWPPQAQAPVVQAQPGNAPEVVVFAGSSITVDPTVTVRFVGRRAVALLSHGDVTIEGLINLRALSATLPGAGADSPLCGVGGTGGGDREGGGGGGFLDVGGSGGRAATPNGGAANGDDPLQPLRGGCSGGLGWGQDAGFAGGGGGLQITARAAVRLLDGGIAAPGLGGLGGVAGSAASGGGSGGAVLLQAFNVLAVNAYLTANGGGGGEGGTRRTSPSVLLSNGDAGAIGAFRSTLPAPGGSGGNCCGGNGGVGGAGEDGGTAGTNGDTMANNEPAGGGGGGSRGRLHIDVVGGGSCTLTQTIESPRVTEGLSTTCQRN
ncbi:MAG: hypothetical protein JNJ54_23000 [Myxococcaceae bacterium]|nr:hypothetical protein [Myxococcaceae bacterium]